MFVKTKKKRIRKYPSLVVGVFSPVSFSVNVKKSNNDEGRGTREDGEWRIEDRGWRR